MVRPIHADLEAERWTLGSILSDRETAGDLVPLLEVEDFRLEGHRAIYRAIRDLYELGRMVDAIALAVELTRRGEYEEIGGDDALAGILGSVPYAVMAVYHQCQGFSPRKPRHFSASGGSVPRLQPSPYRL